MSEAMRLQAGRTPAWLLFRGWPLASLERAFTSTPRLSANSSWLCAAEQRIRTQQRLVPLAKGACCCWLLAQRRC